MNKELFQANIEVYRIEKENQELENAICVLKKSMQENVQRVLEIESKLEGLNEKIKGEQYRLQEIQRKSKVALIGTILGKLAERKLGTKEEICKEIEQLNKEAEFLVKAKNQSEEEFIREEEECKRKEEMLRKGETGLLEEEQKCAALEAWIDLKNRFQELLQMYSDALRWDDSSSRFNICREITVRRN